MYRHTGDKCTSLHYQSTGFTFSSSQALRKGTLHHKAPVMWSYGVFFAIIRNKLLNKQSNAGKLRLHNTHVTVMY